MNLGDFRVVPIRFQAISRLADICVICIELDSDSEKVLPQVAPQSEEGIIASY
jgi:hypothetical protein